MPTSEPRDLFAGTGRPAGGYLRPLRQTLGLSLKAVAGRLGVSPQAVHQFEKSEAEGAISLRQLQNVVRAMGGRLTYTVGLPGKKSATTTTAANPPPPEISASSPSREPSPSSSGRKTAPVSLELFSVTSD
jgi:transcriptional regulator with XRE-family HTH domain